MALNQTEPGHPRGSSTDGPRQDFIEDMAYLFERAGHPRMTGRILAWLLVADPAYQTAGQIGDGLGASKGSVSTSLRSLVEWGLVERFTMPPRRVDHYRVVHGMWPEMVRRDMAVTHALIHVGERGLALLRDAGDERRAPLREMVDFYRFYEEETDALLDRWRRQHDAMREGDQA